MPVTPEDVADLNNPPLTDVDDLGVRTCLRCGGRFVVGNGWHEADCEWALRVQGYHGEELIRVQESIRRAAQNGRPVLMESIIKEAI